MNDALTLLLRHALTSPTEYRLQQYSGIVQIIHQRVVNPIDMLEHINPLHVM